MTRATLRLEPFDAPYTVVLGAEARDTVLKEHNYTPEVSRPRGAVYRLQDDKTGTYAFVVFLPEKYDASLTYHEALHLVMDMMRHHDWPLLDANQEVLCYMQDYVVRQIRAAVYPKARRTIKDRAVE